jgi:hypothetical protein
MFQLRHLTAIEKDPNRIPRGTRHVQAHLQHPSVVLIDGKTLIRHTERRRQAHARRQAGALGG